MKVVLMWERSRCMRKDRCKVAAGLRTPGIDRALNKLSFLLALWPGRSKNNADMLDLQLKKWRAVSCF